MSQAALGLEEQDFAMTGAVLIRANSDRSGGSDSPWSGSDQQSVSEERRTVPKVTFQDV